ncbi:hypothetical protein RFI_28326 [Reticulomyxa filosa]|uniref:Uncharacterized protein n=1 Tax=Reticulomyxa filosa TaxID=46433 RepID=X6M5Y6_RETFI|nr:hypothetical protein RFI_28326 [Reticulomyxa filosa]|eukprot:ETO09061.1 hypothetical protein RFI_28326 [Reticulomyxa filosa]
MSEDPEKITTAKSHDEMDEEISEDPPAQEVEAKNFDQMMENLEIAGDDDVDMEEQYIDVDMDGTMGKNAKIRDGGDKEQKQMESIDITNDSIHAFLGHDDEPVYSVAFNPAFSSTTHLQVLSGGGDDCAYLWEVAIPVKKEEDEDQEEAEEEEPIEMKSEATDAISQENNTKGDDDVATNPNATTTITTGKENEENGHLKEYTHKFANHKDTIVAVQYSKSHNHEYFAVASMDNSISIYHKNELYERLEGPGAEVEWIDWHPKGLLLLCGARDNTVWLWQIHTQPKKQQKSKILQVFGGHLAPVICGAFTKSGKNCYTGSEDGSLFFWDCNTGKAIHHFSAKSKLFHQSVVTTCDDQYNHPIIATGGDDHKIILLNYKSGSIIKCIFEHKDAVECVAFGSDNTLSSRYLLSASLDGLLNIYDVEKNGMIRSQCPHDNGVIVARWFNTQPLIATGDMSGIISIWDARIGTSARRFRGHLETVQSLDISLDDKWLVSGSDDGSALVFPMHL